MRWWVDRAGTMALYVSAICLCWLVLWDGELLNLEEDGVWLAAGWCLGGISIFKSRLCLQLEALCLDFEIQNFTYLCLQWQCLFVEMKVDYLYFAVIFFFWVVLQLLLMHAFELGNLMPTGITFEPICTLQSFFFLCMLFSFEPTTNC